MGYFTFNFQLCEWRYMCRLLSTGDILYILQTGE